MRVDNAAKLVLLRRILNRKIQCEGRTEKYCRTSGLVWLETYLGV